MEMTANIGARAFPDFPASRFVNLFRVSTFGFRFFLGSIRSPAAVENHAVRNWYKFVTKFAVDAFHDFPQLPSTQFASTVVESCRTNLPHQAGVRAF